MAVPPPPTPASSTPLSTFPFVQVDLAGSLGFTDGRYPVRTSAGSATDREATEAVLVVRTVGATLPSRRRRRAKARKADAKAGPTVSLTRLTVIAATPLDVAPDAWLANLRGDERARLAQLDDAMAYVTRALGARRVAAADPGVPELSEAVIAAARLGFGTGDELVEGRWGDAIDIPREESRRRSRTDALRPEERFAAILGGREVPLLCEEPLLRSRADLDASRGREAALQLRIALEALLAESERLRSPGQEEDLAVLDGRRRITGEAANEALRGALSSPRLEEVTQTLAMCERVLRRRAAAG